MLRLGESQLALSTTAAVTAAVTIETAVLPRDRAIRICHEGSHDELAIAYSAALTEIGKRHSRPASPSSRTTPPSQQPPPSAPASGHRVDDPVGYRSQVTPITSVTLLTERSARLR